MRRRTSLAAALARRQPCLHTSTAMESEPLGLAEGPGRSHWGAPEQGHGVAHAVQAQAGGGRGRVLFEEGPCCQSCDPGCRAVV